MRSVSLIVALLVSLAFGLASSAVGSDGWQLRLREQGLNIKMTGAKAAKVKENVWRLESTSGKTQGSVSCGRHSMTCRINPGTRDDIVQTRFGRCANNSRVNAIFDPDTDCAVVFSSGQILPQANGSFRFSASGSVEVEVIRNYYKERLHVRFYKPIDKTIFRTPPSGWCDCYYYSSNIFESDMIANTDWLARVLKPFGAEYVQLDDGWQGRGDAGDGDNRDWFVTSRTHFPRGLHWLADQIHARGMKAGLWVTPYGQSNSAFFKKDPSMWLKRADGTSIGQDAGGGSDWVGRYILDTSNPKSQKYLYDMFHKFAQEWGYDYFKLDGQPNIPPFYTKYHAQLYDPSVSKPDTDALGPQEKRGTQQELYYNQATADGEAYRLGLKAIRDGIGKDHFLLGCGGTPLLNEVGIMDGARTGGDVGASWRGPQVASGAIREGYFLHNIVWYSDPDVLCVRPPMKLNQARFWATMLGLTGQVLMASDNMPALPDDRVEILKRVFPAADITPVDLYPYSKNATVWDVKVSTDAGDWDVVGLLNYDNNKPCDMSVSMTDLGLESGNYAAYDFWNQSYLGEISSINAKLEAQSCQVLALHKIQNHPQVVSTSRHILQGAIDLHKVKWDTAKLELSGTSDVVAGDPYEIRILAPAGYELKSVSASGGVRCVSASTSGLTNVKLMSETSCSAAWTVRFSQRSAGAR